MVDKFTYNKRLEWNVITIGNNNMKSNFLSVQNINEQINREISIDDILKKVDILNKSNKCKK